MMELADIQETRAENARVIEEFRRNAGKVGGRYERTDLRFCIPPARSRGGST
jgi:hypothetical protein